LSFVNIKIHINKFTNIDDIKKILLKFDKKIYIFPNIHFAPIGKYKYKYKSYKNLILLINNYGCYKLNLKYCYFTNRIPFFKKNKCNILCFDMGKIAQTLIDNFIIPPSTKSNINKLILKGYGEMITLPLSIHYKNLYLNKNKLKGKKYFLHHCNDFLKKNIKIKKIYIFNKKKYQTQNYNELKISTNRITISNYYLFPYRNFKCFKLIINNKKKSSIYKNIKKIYNNGFNEIKELILSERELSTILKNDKQYYDNCYFPIHNKNVNNKCDILIISGKIYINTTKGNQLYTL
jgi:hypothetical protein